MTTRTRARATGSTSGSTRKRRARAPQDLPVLVLEPEAERAHRALSATLVALAEDGTAVPCVAVPDLFTSASADDRASATELCGTCPALAACRTYAEAADERHHVWGGRDRWPRSSKRVQATTECSA